MTTIAIDGPGGSGKSTVARAVAARLGLAYLDTGAMYRALALMALRREVSPDAEDQLVNLALEMDLDLEQAPLLFGEDVSGEIRTKAVTDIVSVVAAHPKVRSVLVELQRAFVHEHNGAVVEGRDIGTVVLPKAELKVFLTADELERAKRRASEHHATPDAAEIAEQVEAIARRDGLDSTRSASPLVIAEGALVIDSTTRSVEEVVEEICAHLEGANGRLGVLDQKAPEQPRAVPAHDPVPPVLAPSRGELVFYSVCRAIVVGLSHVLFPGPVIGAEHLPASGPYVVAPVHRSNLDWLLVARITKRRLRYLVKDEVWKVAAAGRLLEMLGAFGVRRDAADREALRHAISALQGDEPLVVFPEGTRRSGPVVEELKEGATYLALRAKVPIVPVGVAGTEEAMPRGQRLPRFRRVHVVVGEPLFPPKPSDPTRERVSRRAAREFNEQLQERLQAVFDQARALNSRKAQRNS